jgi:hypothetical protein
MKRQISSRLTRARQNTPKAPPDLSAMTPMERFMWASDLVGLETLVRAANGRPPATPAEAAEGDARVPRNDPEAPPDVASPPTPAAPAPAPPPKPKRPRLPWEPDPDYVPPVQNEYWKERCHFRVRGADEPYVYEEPPEQSEDDRLIYGDG